VIDLVELRVPEDSPFVDGHFPDTPVLPAGAQVGMVMEALRAMRDHPVRLAGIEYLRLRHPVRPGDVLMLRGVGNFDFELCRDGERVTHGSLRIEDLR